MDDHPQRITDQDNVYSGLLRQAGKGKVVEGKHGQLCTMLAGSDIHGCQFLPLRLCAVTQLDSSRSPSNPETLRTSESITVNAGDAMPLVRPAAMSEP